ncbi:unnamed protein product [Paramecium octaurelia]|uniref:Uncharacterized protein n=1 Tax=Paramecium octaurelia TaxID=43137 RepID=A0A8S1RZI5_PAROT|nr:unnamed protein product [Paramecium octaurelia]
MEIEDIKEAISFESITCRQTTKEIEVVKMGQTKEKPFKAKLQITFTVDNEIIYLYDGINLRKEYILDSQDNPQILANMDQIQHRI